jgi:hypothetical protein
MFHAAAWVTLVRTEHSLLVRSVKDADTVYQAAHIKHQLLLLLLLLCCPRLANSPNLTFPPWTTSGSEKAWES